MYLCICICALHRSPRHGSPDPNRDRGRGHSTTWGAVAFGYFHLQDHPSTIYNVYIISNSSSSSKSKLANRNLPPPSSAISTSTIIFLQRRHHFHYHVYGPITNNIILKVRLEIHYHPLVKSSKEQMVHGLQLFTSPHPPFTGPTQMF